ncbi:hypothetical protein [Acinetobacter terrae]|jgi:hypothetical protein|uniref:hypothetical protein n=1 Tax=Acinetobacter terrae TaxID=2731247 RepID=UPI0007D76721|nr:hypothetical protein [Acinetobacter terrae]OAL85330.1 hypothetical protein AY608_02530 [Acinetobacter terrae]
MNQFKLICISLVAIVGTGCQVISPLFVNYNGVRMDVARWINNQQLLSMQQKRSLAQLSKAQQKLYRIEQIPEDQKLAIAKQNQIALHCAYQYLTEHKISQLQLMVFGADKKDTILEKYDQEFPKIKLATSAIQCE